MILPHVGEKRVTHLRELIAHWRPQRYQSALGCQSSPSTLIFHVISALPLHLLARRISVTRDLA